jgi:hypothetical protein
MARMPRRLLLSLLAAAALLVAVPSAWSATPFTAGTGDRPQIAVGPDGTGYVTWMVRQSTGEGDLVGYCRVPRAARACERVGFIPFPGSAVANGGEIAEIFTDPDDASRVLMLASCWNCGAGGTTDRVYVRGSSDGGATFGLPVEAGRGLLLGGQAAWLRGASPPLLVGVGGGALLAMDAAAPTTSTVAFTSSGIIATPAVTEVHGASQLLAASSDLDAVRFAVYAGPVTRAGVNTQASWTRDRPVPGAAEDSTETSLASGPSGTFLAYRRARLGDDWARLHRYDPVTQSFDAGREIQGPHALDDDVLEPDLAQDASGRLHAVWRSGLRGGRLRYTRSDDAGASFATAGNLALSEPFGDPEVAAAADGTGFAVFNGAGGAVRVVELAPQPEPDVAAPPAEPPAEPVADPPAVPAPAGPRPPAELEVTRLLLGANRFRVSARIRPEATGRLRIRLRARGRTRTFAAPIARGRVTLRRALPRRMADARTGSVTLSYSGDSGMAAERVALRAGRRPARLRPARPVLDSGRLRARGSLAPAARGRVELRVSFLAGGAYRAHRVHARIARGRYRVAARLPAALRSWLARREGAVRVTTTYAGRAGRGVHGEQRIATATVG